MSAIERGAVREVARWLVSGAIILTVHGGAAAVLVNWTEPLPAGSPQPAILLDLEPSSGAPPAEKSDVAPDVVDQRAEFTPDPAPIEKVEEDELEPVKEEVVEKQPDPLPEPPPPEPPLQKPAEVVLPPPRKPPPRSVQKKKIAAVEKRRVSSDTASERLSSASPGAAGPARASYSQRIVAHLNRHKSYPASARSRREEGTVMLTFTLDRHGKVISSHISRGSGHPELDREALDMLKRAQPFPTPPAELSEQRFPFTAPMRYYLN